MTIEMTAQTVGAPPATGGVDESKAEAFVGRALTDASGFATTLLAGIGDRLGLWKALADHGPLTSAELADRAEVDERYAREWLGGMTAATYVDYSPENGTWALPDEHAPVLAEEGGPVFFGGTFQMLHGMSSVHDELLKVFRTGGGVRQEAYHQDMWDGMERFTAGWFENHLIQEWLPALPEVDAALRAGAMVADVGCGRGRGLIRLAQAYPDATFVGIDAFHGTIEDARANIAAAGLSDRITILHADGSEEIPGDYDVIFTFDVVHDAVDPAGLLRRIRSALRPGGIYVCLDINASHHLEDNVGPLGALFHGCSVMYCMTTSLAHGGSGLGTVGFNETVARSMCDAAGFSSVRRVPMENPFNILYEIR
ncbi:MAG: methyltransferase domain-containing protein [Actinomycetota bacterium]|nr:methyltransferase domain-containing protein [Actinomycetota bacterium]